MIFGCGMHLLKFFDVTGYFSDGICVMLTVNSIVLLTLNLTCKKTLCVGF